MRASVPAGLKRHGSSRKLGFLTVLAVMLVCVVVILSVMRGLGSTNTSTPVTIVARDPKTGLAVTTAKEMPDNNPGVGLISVAAAKAREQILNAKRSLEAAVQQGGAAVSSPRGADGNADLKMEIQKQQWELNYLRNIVKRKDTILAETHDEMLHAFDDLRDALHKIGSSAPSVAAGSPSAPELPCHCLEQSAMAPQDVWCDNHRRRISGAHVCVLRDVCFGGGESIVALSPKSSSEERKGRGMEIARVHQSMSIAFRPQPGSPGSSLFQKIMATPVKNETAIFYASQFPSHITHVQEGAGGLHFSINRNKQHLARHTCEPDDLTCFYGVTTFNFMGAHFPGDWHENMLRIMIEDHDKSVKFNYADGIASQPFQCFARAIMPGFYYSVLPDSEDSRTFQASAAAYLEKNSGTGWRAPREATGKILMSHRTSKRTVVDWGTLVAYVRKFAEGYRTSSGKPITVDEIEFGQQSFVSQATKSADADILLGIHGADLTNLMFQRRGAVMLELNPLFFFENRFYELANNLGIHYMAWTCTNADCAFGGGDASRFMSIVSRFGYDSATRVFRRPGGRELRWPYDRYVGYSCPECDAMGINPMDYRDTNVRVGSSLEEIGDVLERAFQNLGYKGTRPRA